MTDSTHISTLNRWLSLHKGLIFKIVRAYAFNAMDRDDLFQEITLQLWRSIPTFRNECAVSTWIYRISLNTAIRFAQKERKRTEPQTDIENVSHILQENPISIDERLSWLYTEIAKLNEIDRSITLLMLDGFSYKEMAEIIGITETNIGVKINRIKKLLTEKSKTYNHGI